MSVDITKTLEAMVDKHGLSHVLIGLSCICAEKAEHLRVNWQDSKSARSWDADSKKLETVARNVAT